MNADEERELDWWRTVFSCRFMSDNLPRPGDALFGLRFRLVDDDSGETYSRDAHRDRLRAAQPEANRIFAERKAAR